MNYYLLLCNNDDDVDDDGYRRRECTAGFSWMVLAYRLKGRGIGKYINYVQLSSSM